MKRRMTKLTTAGALTLAFCATGFAATPAPDIARAMLTNGLRVIVVRDALAPVVTTNVSYLVGSDEAPAAFPGMAHAMEHMMFRGSPGLSRNQLLTIAANMGGAYNAETQHDVTQYFFTVPAHDLDVALHVAAIRMRGADITPKGWQAERGAIEQEVSGDMSNPMYKLHAKLLRHVFAGTPYAHTPLGTRASFDKLTATQLRKFHNTWYAPNNAVLVIAGDVDPQAVLGKVKHQFGSIPRKQLPARPVFHFKPIQSRTFKTTTDLPVPLVALAWRAPGTNDGNSLAVATVLAGALDSKRGKLYALGLTGKALGASFRTSMQAHAGMAYTFAAMRPGSDPQQMIHTLRGIIQNVVEHGVPADLIKTAKQRALASFDYKGTSVSGVTSAWISAVAFRHQESPDDLRAQLAAVTPAQVNALARKIFDPKHVDTLVAIPQPSGKPISHKTFGGAEKFTAKSSKPAVLPAWAKADFSTLPHPHSMVHPTSFTLPNGLKVIVQHEAVSPTVVVVGQIKTNADVQAPKGKRGVASLTNAMFNFGTAHMSRLQFATALDAINANENAGTRFSLSIPADAFAKGMQLLADQELHPAFRPRMFAIMQQKYLQSQAGTLTTPSWKDTLAYNRALYPAHSPQVRYVSLKSIRDVTLADVKAYYQQVFRPDMTSIVVVGDVTPAQARKVIEKDFGAWKAHGPKPDVAYPKVPLNKASRFHVGDASKVQDQVTLGEVTNLTEYNPQRFAMEVGNHILGGGMHSHLMRDLRIKAGLVYGVSSDYDNDQNIGSFSVSYACDPDKVNRARAMVVADIKAMQTTPVNADTLRAAKGQLLRDLILSQSSYGSIANNLLAVSISGKPLDSFTLAAHAITNTTAAQIQQVFRQYVRPNALVTNVYGPAVK